MADKQYVCIDLKSFYASVECVERNLDPMTAHLVVADPERQETTICLAVTPAMKALGVKNRCRIFEIPKSIEYIKAPPRMKLYIEYSANIYAVYLKYIAKEDIHVYSIDEAFLDVTDYLALYNLTAVELAEKIRQDVLETVGITATCGIGTNLYLAKVALDIMAKRSPNFIGILTETMYREKLWNHRPLTDFWRIGSGIARRLEERGICTMGDITRCPEKILYQMLGVDAEILIDHAWGREPTTIGDIKAYRAQAHTLTSGQVLPRDYSFEEGLLIIKEMADSLILELFEKKLRTPSVTLHVGYTKGMLKPAHGTERLPYPADSQKVIMKHTVALYKRIVDRHIPVRRITLIFNDVTEGAYEQLNLFDNQEESEQEKRKQQMVSDIKKKYGKNAILKGIDLQDAATTQDRNRQIGGHKSGE